VTRYEENGRTANFREFINLHTKALTVFDHIHVQCHISYHQFFAAVEFESGTFLITCDYHQTDTNLFYAEGKVKLSMCLSN
jgi:hypothetical protein